MTRLATLLVLLACVLPLACATAVPRSSRVLELQGERFVLTALGNPSGTPVLFLHGGPGFPETPLIRHFNEQLLESFRILHWYQPGTGRAFRYPLPEGERTIAHLEARAEILLEALAAETGGPMLVMAHSFGTSFGIRLARRRPDLVRAYVGIGQMIDMNKNERLSYERTLAEARKQGLTEAEQNLLALGPPPYQGPNSSEAMLRERSWVHATGGFVFGATNLRRLTWIYITKGEYGPLTLLNLLRGEEESIRAFWPDIQQYSILAEPRGYETPIFFALGRHDRTVVSDLAADYLESIEAPDKAVFWFESSAHCPVFEEPALFAEVLQEITRRAPASQDESL